MYHFYRQIASAYLKTNYKNAKFIIFSLFTQIAINDIGAKISAPLEMMEIKISFYLLTAYQILHLEAEILLYHSMNILCQSCTNLTFRKAQPMRFGEIPHRLFSLYIAVQILKNIIGKRLDFLWIQSYNIASPSEYFVFLSLYFNARAFGVLGHTYLLFLVIFEFEKRPQ